MRGLSGYLCAIISIIIPALPLYAFSVSLGSVFKLNELLYTESSFSIIPRVKSLLSNSYNFPCRGITPPLSGACLRKLVYSTECQDDLKSHRKGFFIWREVCDPYKG